MRRAPRGSERQARRPTSLSLSLVLLARPLAEPELLHLELQTLAGDLEETRRVRDVAVRLPERPAHEVALEAAHCDLHVLLEAALRGQRAHVDRGDRTAFARGHRSA